MGAVARRGLVTVAQAPPEIFRLMAKLPGYKRWLDDGGAMFEASRKHVELWDAMFPDSPIEDADGSLAKLYVERIAVTEQPYLTEAVGGEPWAHQRRAHNVMMARPYYGFFHDMGTGKSRTIIRGFAELYVRKLIDRVLVICNGRGRPQFMEEQLPMWMPGGILYRSAELPSTKAKRLFQYPKGDLLIAFTTHSTLQSKKQTVDLQEFCKGGRTAIFIDESQNEKGWSTNRVDNLLTLKPLSTHRFLFSGEPEPNGYEDLFAQFYFMDENILGHASLSSFENHYCIKGGFGLKQIIAYQHTEELAAAIAPHCEYIKLTECMDMPERSWHEGKFKPIQEQIDLYQQVKKDYAVFVERALNDKDVEVVAKHCKNAAARYTAMRQIACGWFYADLTDETLPRDVVHITDERASFTIEELVGTSGKCLVWASHYEDLEQIKRVTAELKIEAVEFSGRLTPHQCEANKIRFQTDPKCRIFYGTTASGGESLNLQMAHRAVYYSNSFNWGHREQSERRIWRAGQTEPCSYLDVIGFPIDRIIRNNALEKKDLAMQLKTAAGLAAMLEQL